MATQATETVITPQSIRETLRDDHQREFLAVELLDVIRDCLHMVPSEWIFLRELKVGTGIGGIAAQRLDAFALNCFAHKAMKRICYEVKVSRTDFLCELKHPSKRRTGLRYSNEFYFVTPQGLLKLSELPIECGLVEIGTFKDDSDRATADREDLIHFEPKRKAYCRVTVPAPWRDTPGPTWQFVAAMMRNQQRALGGAPPAKPKQQRLAFFEPGT